MKLKNFAMITEDKVTEIFCIADDFCKVFDAQMAKYTFKAEGKRKYHRESRMSKAEIMIIMILFHSSGYRCLKHFYLEKICKHIGSGSSRAREFHPHPLNFRTLTRLRNLSPDPLYFQMKRFTLACSARSM